MPDPQTLPGNVQFPPMGFSTAQIIPEILKSQGEASHGQIAEYDIPDHQRQQQEIKQLIVFDLFPR